jgi:hypothetical protein
MEASVGLFDYTQKKSISELTSFSAKCSRFLAILENDGLVEFVRRVAIKTTDPLSFSLVLLFGKSTFLVDKCEYLYSRKWKYRTWNTERRVEIPIALKFIKGTPSNKVLEVGNVLHNYCEVEHSVVDKYEIAPDVINQDIVDFRPNQKFARIVCISTLEHVGRDELPRDDKKAIVGLKVMRSFLEPDGRLLVTIPMGWNLPLEEFLLRECTGSVVSLRRASNWGAWSQCEFVDSISDRDKYRIPFGARAILVCNLPAA